MEVIDTKSLVELTMFIVFTGANPLEDVGSLLKIEKTVVGIDGTGIRFVIAQASDGFQLIQLFKESVDSLQSNSV